MKFKKGELTTQQIVLLILLLVGFIIILLLLFRLDLGNEDPKQICHNSVVIRANKAVPTDAVPLKCERNYVCLTRDGSCENMLDPQKFKVKTEDEVYEVLANEMLDCWWMFGEGELNYVGSDNFPEMYCSLCSQIKFDDSVKEISGFEQGNFDKENLYKFMAETQAPGKEITYSEYLFKTNDYSAFLNTQDVEIVNFGEVDLNKQYYVLTGMTSSVSQWGSALKAVVIGGVAVTGIVLSPLTGTVSTWVAASIIGGYAVGAGVGAYYLAPVIQNSWGGQVISPSLIEVNSEEFQALGCKDISTLS